MNRRTPLCRGSKQQVGVQRRRFPVFVPSLQSLCSSAYLRRCVMAAGGQWLADSKNNEWERRAGETGVTGKF